MPKGTESRTKNTKQLQTYYFQLEGGKEKQLSREIIKVGKGFTQIHYPIGFKGGPKYKTIKRFVYKGFPLNDLPVGVSASPTKGYGFTRHLKTFEKFIDKEYKFDDIVIEKGGTILFDPKKKELLLNESVLRDLKNSFDTIDRRSKDEAKQALETVLHDLFPKVFKKSKKNSYRAGTLAYTINSWGNSMDEFSENDKQAIRDLFDKLSLKDGFLSDDSLKKTKEIIDVQYLQKTLIKYQKLLGTPTAEKRWQDFLRTNSWIFSSILAQPVILYQAEAFVGGKKLDNTNGKITDFLLQNSLSDNISFLEIKTHKTSLCEKNAYRGDDVFSPSNDLAGSIIQVLNQRDTFQKEFYANRYKSGQGKKPEEVPRYETYNSKCIVLCGMLKDLTPNQRNAFELFRNNSRDVDVFTFDELEAKISALQNLMNRK
ncbi:Shedu immune nuclease family protein [Chryseolinea lacunae]|uniref:DUF4263 domain-containing protein n=1 Tax=Chryseolinea lacunae TaxID=2801331 RepID=A0ABS1KMH5_9BACT|nr:Shedu immune nuclease family protein [Chryseolinea lacunae]MBL0740539.1 DUF4263 domain-containing protein [Chryseolinea lacunae]